MKIKIFKALFSANIKEMLRDKMQIFWYILFPIVFVCVFGVLFSGGGKAGGAGMMTVDFILPGVLALTLMQLGLFSSMRILNLRTQQILKSLGTTPMPRTLFLGSEIITRLILSMMQGGLIVLIGHYAFGLTLAAGWWIVIGWILLGISAFIALGYLLTTFARTQESGNALMQVVQFPMMFLAGIFIPPQLMPTFLRPVVKIIPLSYFADGLRSSITGGPSLYGTGVNIAVLSGIVVLCLVFTVLRFKWD